MKRLKLLILVFCAALSIPLAYFVLRTYQGLAQEEVATLHYFADTLFDEMEHALASIVLKEEARAIDEYNYTTTPSGQTPGSRETRRSPLSRLPRKEFLLGYLQNNPDGSFQTPLLETGKKIPKDRTAVVEQLEDANRIFNRKRVAATDVVKPRQAETIAKTEQKQVKGFAEKYLKLPRSRRSRAYLGQKEKRVEKISLRQALNIAKPDQMAMQEAPQSKIKTSGDKEISSKKKGFFARRSTVDESREAREESTSEAEDFLKPAAQMDMDDAKTFQVEMAPMQSVFIDNDQVFIFRRIMINNRIYRQGFIVLVKSFLGYLAETHFSAQPMAHFSNLRLKVMERGRELTSVLAGATANHPNFRLNRTFPNPFSFLTATLTCDNIPQSAGRNKLNIMMAVLAAVVLIGLFAIYKSAQTVVDLSERRSQFVSSVTHELKTPLTNIRMYVEMLEQGIATDHEREQDYFRILGSESARLSRLINNVLELSKLEKKQRHIDLQAGTFEEVIQEIEAVMHEKLKQEHFTLKVARDQIKPFAYDREVMIQVLINLIENSIKFGKALTKKEILLRIFQSDNRVLIRVSDTGPGIPKYALKKVFHDFYRPDSSLSRNTRGTGIGLALVKKFVAAMGGSVTASNNDGPGCTITISMPS